jgi:hypothetical protein
MAANHPHTEADVLAWCYNHIRALEGQLSASTPRLGTATLTAGAATVAMTSITAASKVLLGMVTPGGTVGAPFVFTKTPGTGFVIHSTSGTDTSTVAYAVY